MTTWTDFKLNAPTEEDAKEAARQLEPSFALITGEDEWIEASERHALDVIGTVYNDDAETDPETGDIITPATAQPGWFANLRVLTEIAEPVEAMLAAIGAPLGVTIVEDTGRVWA